MIRLLGIGVVAAIAAWGPAEAGEDHAPPLIPQVGNAISAPNLVMQATSLRTGTNFSVNSITGGKTVYDILLGQDSWKRIVKNPGNLGLLRKELKKIVVSNGSFGRGCVFIAQDSNGDGQQYLRVNQMTLKCR
jgi:hypothetical protein